MRATAITKSTSVSLALVTLGVASLHAQQPTPPPPRSIPGINAEDPYPSACVSCHVVLPDGMDVRLSTLVGQWREGADSALVAIAQAAAPTGMTLTGRHPSASTDNIPGGCLLCHGRTSTMAPPFARMLHRIHLGGGDQNIYLTMFRGECTYCHKLDLTTGAWSIPSGPEP